MTNRVIIPTSELTGDSISSFGSLSKALLNIQYESWDLLRKNYDQLRDVEVKTFEFDGFNVNVQFNPGRIISSSAKVDSKSIKERPCFLCVENLPADQRGIDYQNEFVILCNPYPIFPEHFTIPKFEHLPQRIQGNMDKLLDLSRDLSNRYTVFYNGPKCGASAPDHMHFQAGNKFFMPIDGEFEAIFNNGSTTVFESSRIEVRMSRTYIRNFIAALSDEKESLINFFETFFRVYNKISNNDEEPMLNIEAYYEEGKWRLIIFPREKHRSSHYFAEGDKNILLSPAAVDLGGVCITPRESDFEKITKDDITEIFSEVTLSKEKFDYILNELKNSFTA